MNPNCPVTWQNITGVAKAGTSSVYIDNLIIEILVKKDYLRLPKFQYSNEDYVFISWMKQNSPHACMISTNGFHDDRFGNMVGDIW